jgi:anti-sigma regulatory factor (Ser/Thr protein kinase)
MTMVMDAGRQTMLKATDSSMDLRIPPSSADLSLVRRALQGLAMPPSLLGDAQLLTTELVANSVRHAGLGPNDQIRIQATWLGNKLRVDVRDRTGTVAQPLAGSIRPDPTAESGWGLYLVDQIASRWGTTPGRFWFELDAPRRLKL